MTNSSHANHLHHRTSHALAYTIVTRNHFFLAAALAENFRQFNPAGRFLIVVADADAPATQEPAWDWLAPQHREWLSHAAIKPNFGLENLCSARQICPNEFWQLAFQYTPLELTCCLKGRVADSLIQLGETQLLYLDADTRIFDSVENCLAPLQPAGGVLLTPHLQSPLPLDRYYPNNVDLLRSGVFNGGVLGFVEQTERPKQVQGFLDWWNQCNLHDCIVDPHQGLFVDQRWLDQAPAYFSSVKISRHLGLNVGYWNLHDRRLARTGERWTVRSWSAGRAAAPDVMVEPDTWEPLQVFHFSGAARVASNGDCSCHRLSRHQNRHGLTTFREVELLTKAYLASWVSHNWLTYQAIPYAYNHLLNGEEISSRWREAYRLNSGHIRESAENPFVKFSDSAALARLEAASCIKNLKSGRFQYHLDGLQARIENLKDRLDQLPWRRLVRATQQIQKRWFKRAG
ncbi:MAG: hypothetical protein Q8M16_06545 [Pirellulaceae bacterium]|nr:hypothetical protein [Pirellulaceae bacterium]